MSWRLACLATAFASGRKLAMRPRQSGRYAKAAHPSSCCTGTPIRSCQLLKARYFMLLWLRPEQSVSSSACPAQFTRMPRSRASKCSARYAPSWIAPSGRACSSTHRESGQTAVAAPPAMHLGGRPALAAQAAGRLRPVHAVRLPSTAAIPSSTRWTTRSLSCPTSSSNSHGREFGAVGAQAGEDVLNVVDGEHDATDAQRVRRCVLRLSADRPRRAELHQLEPAVAMRGAHHGDVDVVHLLNRHIREDRGRMLGYVSARSRRLLVDFGISGALGARLVTSSGAGASPPGDMVQAEGFV